MDVRKQFIGASRHRLTLFSQQRLCKDMLHCSCICLYDSSKRALGSSIAGALRSCCAKLQPRIQAVRFPIGSEGQRDLDLRYFLSAFCISKATRLVTDALNKAKENRDRIAAAPARESLRRARRPAGWFRAQAKRIATAKRTEKKTALFSKYDQANMRLLDLSSTVRPQCFQLQHEPVAASQRWCLARAIVTESTVPGQLRKRAGLNSACL